MLTKCLRNINLQNLFRPCVLRCAHGILRAEVVLMRIMGYKTCVESPLFVYLKKHFCPVCGDRLSRVKVSRVVHSESPEAKDYDFEVADITVRGNMRFTHIEFRCDRCGKNYTVKEQKGNEL